jgi:hypothetical protein
MHWVVARLPPCAVMRRLRGRSSHITTVLIKHIGSVASKVTHSSKVAQTDSPLITFHQRNRPLSRETAFQKKRTSSSRKRTWSKSARLAPKKRRRFYYRYKKSAELNGKGHGSFRKTPFVTPCLRTSLTQHCFSFVMVDSHPCRQSAATRTAMPPTV